MYFVKLGRDYLHDPRSDDTHLVSIEMGQELNTCGYCTFKITPTHPLHGKLRERDSGNPVEVYDRDTLLFSGFVWELGQKFDLMGEVSCKGELAYLGDTTVRPYSTVAGAAPLQAPSTVDGYFRWLIDQHNAHTDASKHFEVGINQGARLDPNNHILRASNQIPRTADELQEKLLDSPGGYVFTRHERGIRYIDYLSECADVNAQVIDFGVNLLDYLRTDSAAKLYTAVRPQGAELEDEEGQGTGEHLTVETLPDGVYAKDGDYRKVGDTVYNVDAAQRYGLIELAWSNSDITIAENLLDAGVIALKEFVEPKTTIEIKALDMALIDPSAKPLRTGQLVRVRSRPHGFDSYMLVSKIEPVLDRPDQTLYTLGTTFDSLTGETNRTIRKLNASITGAYDAMAPIDQAAKDAAKKADAADGKAQQAMDALADLHGTFVHIKFSANADGSGMTDAPQADTAYMGVCSNEEAQAPTDPAVYSWTRTLGHDGEEGTPGAPGVDGTPSYVHIKWSNNASGNPMSETPGDYMGTCVDSTEADPTNYQLYTWVKVKGERGLQGLPGIDGEDGVAGAPGADGRTSYFHVKYSPVQNPTSAQITEVPSAYIGTYVDYIQADSTDPAKYAWVKFVGDDGSDGVPGVNGEDGRTSYLHLAYAMSADGTIGFSPSDSAGKTYMGQCTDFVQADPIAPSKYKWSLIKGADGEQGVPGPKGEDGVQLYTWVKYADTPTSGMADSPTGKAYMGLAYNKSTAAESTSYADYAWSLIKGAKGDEGIPGAKGADGKQLYTWVKYATSASGAGMSDDPVGKTYIGLAYNKTTATESTTPTDYTWSLIKGDKGDTGAAGKPGAAGVPGKDGVGISTVTEYYAVSASSTTAPTSFSTTVPSLTATNKYLWNYETIKLTDGSTTSTAKRVIGVYGDKGGTGATGSPGAPGATGNGISSIINYYLASSAASGVTVSTAGWSTAPKATTTTNKYLWNYEKITYTNGSIVNSTPCIIGTHGATGSTGAPGAPGAPGADGADGQMLYGASNTAATTAAKVPASSIAGFRLYVGVCINIKFTYANTAAAPTLNINATGAKQIRLNGLNSAYWIAGATVAFVYDGTYWQVCNTPLYGSTATIGNPIGGNVYVDGDSVNLRQNTTVLARLKAGVLELAAHSVNAVIKLCGGKGSIAHYANTDQLAIMSPNSVAITTYETLADGTMQPRDIGFVCDANKVQIKGLIELWGSFRSNSKEGTLADWVIAEGTSGGWKWRKWASGRAECTGSFSIWVSTPTAWGAFYYGSVSRQSYPFTFSGAPEEFITLQGGNFWLIAANNSSTQTHIAYCVSAGVIGSTNVWIEYNTVGRWK